MLSLNSKAAIRKWMVSERSNESMIIKHPPGLLIGK